MYKDVWKRILAVAVTVCMVVGMMPETVMAAEAKNYHTYQHGSGSTSGWAEAATVAAIFTVGQNSSGGAEILDSVSFNAHLNEEGRDASATVSYYVNPTQGKPDSGTYVCAKPVGTLKEGMNSVEMGFEQQELKAGDTFAVVISLEGASVACYNGASAGQTYLLADGSWQDASTSGKCVAVRAYTYNVGDTGTDTRPWLEQITSVFSQSRTANNAAVPAALSVNASLNKTSMLIPVDNYGYITLNDADGLVTWTSKDTTIAEVERSVGANSAIIWAKKQGDTIITASYGGETFDCSLRVSASLTEAVIALTPDSVTYDGANHKPQWEVKIGDVVLKENTDYSVSCVSVAADSSETGVDISATDTFANAGTYRFTFTGQEAYGGTEQKVDYVVAPKQVTDTTVEAVLAAWNPAAPDSYITQVNDTARGVALSQGTEADASGDYYLTYTKDTLNNVTAINVNGRGNYAGVRTYTTPVSIAGAEIILDQSTPFIYLGREWQPGISVAISVDGEEIILPADGYTVNYRNNVAVGTATIEVTGQNGYFGTVAKTFEIAAKDIENKDNTSVQSIVEFLVSNAVGDSEPDILATYNGSALEKGTDYRIVSHSNDQTAGTGECVVEGLGNYTGTRTLTYKVTTQKITDIADGISVADMIYTGQALTPAVVLTKQGMEVTSLTEGTDYTVSYKDNVNAGTATVVVQGKGEYAGSLTQTFTIQKADLSKFAYQFKNASGNAVSVSNYQVDYSRKLEDMKPGVIVTYNGNILTEGKEYSLEYSIDGKQVTDDLVSAKVQVTVKAKDSNYTGEQTFNYSVRACDLESAVEAGLIKVTLSKTNFNYTGEVQKPTPTLAYADGTELLAGDDYTYTYQPTDQPKEVGEYSVRITAGSNHNFAGSVEKTFRINGVDIQTLGDITADKTHGNHVTDYKGTWFAMMWFDDSLTGGSNNELKLIIKNGNETLVEGTDYTLSYENVNQVSDSTTFAKVKITGKGTYTGEREIYYLLAGRLEDYTLSLADEKLVYTGAELALQDESITVKTGSLFWKDVLTQNVDYRVRYDKNCNAGTAEIYIEAVDDTMLPTVNGCYRYEDNTNQLTRTFNIAPKNINDTDVVLTSAVVKEYKGAKVTLTVDDIPLVYNEKELGAADFTIDAGSYSNNSTPSDKASVEITGTGNFTGTRKISFVVKGKSLDGAVAEVESAVYTGKELHPEITKLTIDGVDLTKGEDADYTYTIADYKDNINAGTGKITIHGCGEYVGSTTEIPFTIAQRDISDTAGGNKCTVEGVDLAYTYTSAEIVPANVVVKYQISGLEARKLTLGEDYTVSYRDNMNCTTNAAVVIEGTGNYTGTVEKTFEIQQKDIAASDIEIAEIPAQTFSNGAAIQPIPEISYRYGKSDADVYYLTSQDYTLTYSSNRNVGTATITIKGQGNFTGQTEVNFQIGNAILDKATISCPEIEAGTTYIYKGSSYKPEVRVINNTTQGELEPGTDYKVEYGENTDVGTGTVKVVGIGAYAGEKEFTFEIKPKNLSDSDVELAIEGVKDGSYLAAYTGKPVTPKVTITYNGKTVNSYDVSYGADNTNIGIVKVTVTAKAGGNFTGTIQNTVAAKFTIGKAAIGMGGSEPASGFTLEKVEPQPLGSDGTAKPRPQLYYNGSILTVGKDYTYSYEKNNAIGTDAVVILTGIGNYTGSVRQKFEIRGNIADATIEMPSDVSYGDYVTANGGVAPSEILLADDEIVLSMGSTELQKGVDYEVSYANNTWVGTATITFKGIGNYAGTVTKDFMITAKLTESAVTVAVGDQQYSGSPIKAIPVVKYYGKALTEGDHFIIASYKNNTNITDSAEVTIIGNDSNGFTGTRTETFSIVANTDMLEISGVADSYLYRGQAIEPTVVVKAGNVTLTPNDYDIYYGENLHVGTGSISIIGKGNYAGNTKYTTFKIEPLEIRAITVLDGKSTALADREYTGVPILPELSLTTKIGSTTYTLPESDYKVSVSADSDNVSVGTVTLVIEGTTSSKGKQNITGSQEVSFDIVPKSLSKPASGQDKISMQVTQDTYAYDGTAKEPEVIVTYQYGSSDTEVRTLNKGTDYTIAYSNNIAAGTAQAIVTGIGNYSGSRTANFTITSQDISAATVTLPNGTVYPYMGSTVPVEPEVAVAIKGTVLTKDVDYAVSYQNSKTCGTATVTITGKGDFSGTTATTYTIEAHSINAADVVVESIPNQAYTGSPIVPELTITCGAYRLIEGLDYQLNCTGNTEIGQASVTISGINGFKDSRTELFKIASNIEQAEVTGLKESYVYTGQPLTIEQLGITGVQIGNTVLSTTDYTVTFAQGCDGMSVGKQTVVLIGTGNYGGSKKMEITITAKNIADADVVMSGFAESLPYENRLEQNIALTWGAITLQKGTDYEVVCSPSQSADTYVMTITGQGNYAGTIEKSYAVEKAVVDSLEIKDVSSDYTYNGQAIEPKPRVLLGDAELKEGVDYTLAYANNVNVGVATLYITGTGTCFTGEKEIPFTILRRSINHGTASAIATQIYTGKDVYPAVEMTDNGTVLAEGTDYTLMYKNNRRAGTSTVVVAGKGNYTSTKTIPFAIRPCNAASATVIGVSKTSASITWTGEGVVTGYEIYRMAAGGKWQLVGGTKATNYMDEKLSADTIYSYKIRSYVVEDGETYYGEFSNVVSATTSK